MKGMLIFDYYELKREATFRPEYLGLAVFILSYILNYSFSNCDSFDMYFYICSYVALRNIYSIFCIIILFLRFFFITFSTIYYYYTTFAFPSMITMYYLAESIILAKLISSLQSYGLIIGAVTAIFMYMKVEKRIK